MSFFTPIDAWTLPESALAESYREMARDGIEGNEGVALWLGRRRDGQAEVTHLVAFRGPGVIKRPDQLIIRPHLLNDVTDLAIELGAVLVGQIHSHGGLYGTDLSYADHTFGIKVPFFLSLVAPDFALRPKTRLEDCGVHLFEPASGFRRLSAAEAVNRIRLVPSPPIPVIAIGQE